MRGIGGLIGIAAGLVVMVFSIFSPENTFLSILLLTFGALSCSWEGVNDANSARATFWTGIGVATTTFTVPFFTVFGAPVSILFTLSVGLMIVAIAVMADRYAGGTEQSSTLGNRACWPLLGIIMLVGTLTALLIRALQ